MTTSDQDVPRGLEMSVEDAEAFLTGQGHGVLALADSSIAYAVPVSYGYDGEAVYLSLIQFGDASEKLAFLGETERAVLVVYEVDTPYQWRSVLVRGELQLVPTADYDYMQEVMGDSAWIPSMFPPPEPMTDFVRIVLIPQSVSGRQGVAHQDDSNGC